ncbi:MAG: hypothetical protein ABI743_10125, partial [bacterium]
KDEETSSNPRAQEERMHLMQVSLDAPLPMAHSVRAVAPLDDLPLLREWPASWQQPWEGQQAEAGIPVAGMEPNRSFEGLAQGYNHDGTVMTLWLAPEMPYAPDPLIPVAWQGQLPLYAIPRATTPFDAASGGPRLATLPIKLESVCGMALAPDGSALYLLDRNMAKIHRCTLDNANTITAVATASLTLAGPSGESYILPSLESLTIDDQGHLWSAVDPWKYVPLTDDAHPLPAREAERYAEEIPLLYKFDEWPETSATP